MMLAILTSLMVAVAGAPEAALVHVHEIDAGSGAVSLALEGPFHVHAWVTRGGTAALAVNGGECAFEEPPGGDSPCVWLTAKDAITLTPGDVAIRVGADVHAIAFTRRPQWQGDKVLRHARVFHDRPARVDDARARNTRHTDTRFTMPPVRSREVWEREAETLRTRIRVASGLYPWPEKTPLNARVFDRFEGDGFTVEKVHFEAYPGYLVTGNLYKPAGGGGPFPGVVSPHGHWEHGRLEHSERGSVPGRAITLARMGCVVFTYDMIGYVDSLQFPHNWGSPALELHGLHPFAFQLWSGIRAIDFLAALPEVDARRIACTGASGGGTQTFALTAVDDRIRVSAPVNMISSTMQGGCLCENAPLIRLAHSNMEIAALAAPRPLLLVSATGDWTRETPRVEYPAIREVYGLYGAEAHVTNVHIDAPHNYNLASREAMYRFFGEWLLGDPEKFAQFTEPAFDPPPVEALRVFDGEGGEAPSHRSAVSLLVREAGDAGLPPTARAKEDILESVQRQGAEKWAALLPRSPQALAPFRARFAHLYRDAFALTLPDASQLVAERVGIDAQRDYVAESWILGRPGAGDQIPAILYRNSDLAVQEAVLIVDGGGKVATVNLERGGPGPGVAALLAAGKAVLVIDPFLTGEHHAPRTRANRLLPGRFIHTFQPSDTLCRIQDVLTALAWLGARRDIAEPVGLVGRGDGAVWATFAAAAAGPGAVGSLTADFSGLDLTPEVWEKHFFIPGILGLGGLDTALALVDPGALDLHGLPARPWTTQ